MVTKKRSGLKTQLGLPMATALVMGNMIGSGIFLLPASLASFGGISLLGWLFTAAGATVLALVFADLNRIRPRSGGPYGFTRDGFGDFAGFLVAWGYWVSIWIGNAAIATAGVGYLSVFWPVLAESATAGATVAVSSIWLLTLVNAHGVRSAGYVQVLTTVLKILPLILLGTLGLAFLNLEHFVPFNASSTSNFTALTSSATLTLWALLGLESASIPANEIADPEKNIPRATLLGTVFTAVIYILGTVGVMGILPAADLAGSSAPFADAATRAFGGWAGQVVAAGAAISCFGALNGWILLQGQLPRAVAADHLFPEFFGRLSTRKTPVAGLVVSSALATLLLFANYTRGLVGLFTFAILLATLNTLVPYLFTTMAEIVIFFRQRERFSRRFLWRSVVLASAGFIYSLWAVAGAGEETVYWGFILLMAGVPVYVWVGLRRRHGGKVD